jgi:hypothetical protein
MYPFGQLDPEMAVMLDGEDEKSVFWFIEDSQHWYLI